MVSLSTDESIVYGGNYRERRRGKASAYLHSGVSRHVAWKRRARSYNRIPPRARSRLVSSDFAACSTTLITPAARSTGVVYDLSFRRYGITNPCSISSAKHVPRFSCRHFTNRLVRPRTRSSFPFRREHGMELAIIYPGRPIYFFADRK